MTDEVNAVQVEQNAEVDVGRVETQTTTTSPAEESMAEYAARREAEMRGEKYEPPVKEEKPIANDEESTAAAAEAAATGETDAEGKEIPKPGDAQRKSKKDKRIDELTYQREEAKRVADQKTKEAEEAKAELARLREEAKKEAPIIPEVPEAKDDPAPTRDQFEDPEEYAVAKAAHAAREEIRKATEVARTAAQAKIDADKKAQQEAEQARYQEHVVALNKKFSERVDAAKVDYPDFEEKVVNNQNVYIRNDLIDTIKFAETAPHILYRLASNPEEAAELNKMSPYDAAIRIGEIQAEIKLERKPKVSKAADPVTPVGNRASPTRKAPDEMTMEEYAAMRDSEERAARERRSKRGNRSLN